MEFAHSFERLRIPNEYFSHGDFGWRFFVWFVAGIRRAFCWQVAQAGLLGAAIFYLLAVSSQAEKIAQLKTDAIGCGARKTTESLAQAVWRGDQKQIIAIMKSGRSSGNCRQFLKETLVEVLATHPVDVARKGRRKRLVSLAQIRELGQPDRYWVIAGQLLDQ